jgi:branched-chain amino acid transport system ATP-binding protein
VPQLFLTLTPRDNLIAAIGIANGAAFSPTARSDTPGVRHALDELLDRFRLQEFRDRLCSELPSGVRKLLDIAVAVTRAPKLLLLDEPTSGVATGQKFPLMDIVMDALGDDVTVLFVEHDMDIVSRYARRVLAFYEGQIIADGVPAHVLTDARVRNHVTGAIC